MTAELLTPAEVAASGSAIEALQEPDGAIPWTRGGHTDAWNHVEAAMALLVADRLEAVDRAWSWVRLTQRVDGSWPLKVVGGEVVDASGETNMSAYVAVGVWHHWLVRRDLGFVVAHWPVVRRALDFVCGLQLPFGGIAWSQEWGGQEPASVNREALLAGSSSIHHALRAGLTLAELLNDPQPEWELTASRLGHALREHRDLFLDKSTFSMDWYYPVLAGAVRGVPGRALIDTRWDDFVVPGLGVRCVDTNPWVTGAETCELALKSSHHVVLHHTFQEIVESHVRRTELLTEEIRRLGAAPPKSSGIRGAFAKAVQAGADLLGDRTAIAALEGGEDRGLKLYTEGLGDCDPMTRRFVETECLPEQRHTHDLCLRMQESMVASR